jgi:hypothetical protein
MGGESRSLVGGESRLLETLDGDAWGGKGAGRRALPMA